MTILNDTKLETIDYIQAHWDAIMNANSGKFENIFTTVKVLWDGAVKTQDQVVKWNGTAWQVVDAEIPPPAALTDEVIILTDASSSGVFTVTLADDRTFANPTNLTSGKTYFWQISQDATGSRLATFGASWIFDSVPALSTGPNDIDIIRGIAIGTNIYCTIQKNFGTT